MKNIFDNISDSYERFHLKESEVHVGNETLYISPKLKIILGWSVLIICGVLAYLVFGNKALNKTKDKKAETTIDVSDAHDTVVPYEKDAISALNVFIGDYFNAITSCDYQKLQDMVTDASEYQSDAELKRKAEFITGYNNITVYTKEGVEEGSYLAFVVANLTIAGVNSSPYDIMTMYIITGAQGFRIQNGTLDEETQKYIETVKGDVDIQNIFRSVEDKNKELAEQDPSLQEFYDIISRRNVETGSAADDAVQGIDTQSQQDEADGQEQQGETDGQEQQGETDGQEEDADNGEE